MLEQSFSNYQLLSFKIHFRDLPGFTVFTGLKTSFSVFPESHVQYLYDELQMSQFMPTPECDWRDYCQETASLPEMPFTQCPCPPRSLPWQTPTMENGTTLHAWTEVAASVSHVWVSLSCSSVCAGYQLRASIYSYSPADSQPSPFALEASIRSAEALSGEKKHQRPNEKHNLNIWKKKKIKKWKLHLLSPKAAETTSICPFAPTRFPPARVRVLPGQSGEGGDHLQSRRLPSHPMLPRWEALPAGRKCGGGAPACGQPLAPEEDRWRPPKSPVHTGGRRAPVDEPRRPLRSQAVPQQSVLATRIVPVCRQTQQAGEGGQL